MNGGELPNSYVESFKAAVLENILREMYNSSKTVSDDYLIEELVGAVTNLEHSVVLCSVLEHLLTASDGPIEFGPYRIVPVTNDGPGKGSLISTVIDQIPGFRDLSDMTHEVTSQTPLALLICNAKYSGIGSDFEPFGLQNRDAEIALRLVYGGTLKSVAVLRGGNRRIGPIAVAESVNRGDLGWFSRVHIHKVVACFEEGHIPALLELIMKIGDIRTNTHTNGLFADSVQTGFDRFFRSTYVYSWDDALLELTVALEGLLGGVGNDVSATLRNRGAALLAIDDDDQISIYGDIQKIYQLRSQIVHGSRIKSSKLKLDLKKLSRQDVSDQPLKIVAFAVGRMYDLVRRAILLRIVIEPEFGKALVNFSSGDFDQHLADPTFVHFLRSVYAARMEEMGITVAMAPRNASGDRLFDI
jgi:hypothetical protein